MAGLFDYRFIILGLIHNVVPQTLEPTTPNPINLYLTCKLCSLEHMDICQGINLI